MSDLAQGQERAAGALSTAWTATMSDYARALAWSADAQTLAVADASGELRALDAATGQRRWAAQAAHEGDLMALAAHPSAPLLASAGADGALRLWSTQDGRLLHERQLGAAWVTHLAWSPRGDRLAAACGRVAHVFEPTGQPLGQTPPHPATLSALDFDARAQLVTACYGQVCAYDDSLVPTQRLAWRGSLIAMALSPDGQIVACGSQDQTVHFWRRQTEEDSMMAGYAYKPSALAFDRSSALLATGGGESVTVWCFDGQGPEGTRPGVLTMHTLPVTCLRFAHTLRVLASGARDHGVIVWAMRPDGEGAPAGLGLVAGAVEAVAWSPQDTSLAAIDAQGQVTLWRVDLAQLIHRPSAKRAKRSKRA